MTPGPLPKQAAAPLFSLLRFSYGYAMIKTT